MISRPRSTRPPIRTVGFASVPVTAPSISSVVCLCLWPDPIGLTTATGREVWHIVQA